MPLSRLENFLKNIQGNVIYVDPNELDATDSIEIKETPKHDHLKRYREL